MGKRARRVALHPARRALAQRIRRIVQLPSARRMPEHQHLLVPDPGPGRHRRLEARLQPLPPPLLAGLFTTSPLRCQLYPPMNGSHPLRTSSRGPATRAITGRPNLAVFSPYDNSIERYYAEDLVLEQPLAPSLGLANAKDFSLTWTLPDLKDVMASAVA